MSGLPHPQVCRSGKEADCDDGVSADRDFNGAAAACGAGKFFDARTSLGRDEPAKRQSSESDSQMGEAIDVDSAPVTAASAAGELLLAQTVDLSGLNTALGEGLKQ